MDIYNCLIVCDRKLKLRSSVCHNDKTPCKRLFICPASLPSLAKQFCIND